VGQKQGKGGCVWFVLALLVIGVVGAYQFWPRTWWNHPEQLLPPGSALVASIDVAALTGSPLWDALGSEAGERESNRLQEACGVDPLTMVREVVVAVTGDSASLEHVVVFARAELPLETVRRCMQEILAGEGRGVRDFEVGHLTGLAGERGDSRLVWLGGGWILFGSQAAVEPIAAAVAARPEPAGPWADAPTEADSTLAGGDVRVRGHVPESWGDSNPLEDGLAGSAARRAIALIGGFSGGLMLDDDGRVRWSLLLTPEGQNTTDALIIALRAWKLAAGALAEGTPMELLTSDLEIEERPDGVLTRGGVSHERATELFRRLVPSGPAPE